MRGFIALCIVAFCAGLGVVVGNRMSSEAMAVVVGVVCGVLAGIPTSVLLLIVVRAQQRGTAKGRGGDERPVQPPMYPPVIVVGGAPQPLPPAQQSPDTMDGAWRALEAPRREFRVIGEE